MLRVLVAVGLEVVRAAYLEVLGRKADPTGLHYWAGTSLARFNIEAALGASEEGQRVTAVRALYRELLLRDPLGPDNAGLRSWVDSPLTLEAIRSEVMNSDEYRRRHGG